MADRQQPDVLLTLAAVQSSMLWLQSGPETIAVKDVADADLWWAAEQMDGFSGAQPATFMGHS